jgi:diguanylate cyclase (GGDEF)-like protein
MSADVDALTGLLTRRVLDDRLDAAIDAGGLVGMLLLDIQDFRGLNDFYGHAVGDQVLMGIARRLEGATYEGDLLIRLGGDEFAVIANCVGDDHDDLAALGREVREAISGTPIIIGGQQVHVRVTIKSGMLSGLEDLARLDGA